MPGMFGKIHRHFKFTNILTAKLFFNHSDVIANGILYVLYRFLFGGARDQQPGKPGTETLKPSSDCCKAILYFIYITSSSPNKSWLRCQHHDHGDCSILV